MLSSVGIKPWRVPGIVTDKILFYSLTKMLYNISRFSNFQSGIFYTGVIAT